MSETLVGQFPKHIGSTGGLLNSAETEEKYAIVWKSPKNKHLNCPPVERLLCMRALIYST